MEKERIYRNSFGVYWFVIVMFLVSDMMATTGVLFFSGIFFFYFWARYWFPDSDDGFTTAFKTETNETQRKDASLFTPSS